MSHAVLVYDSDCGPCARLRRAVEFLDTRNNLDFASLVDADRSGFLDSIPPGRRHRSMHLISIKGDAYSGAQAIPRLVRLLPAGSLISPVLDSSAVTRKVVAFVCSAFSRLRDSGSCSFTSRDANSSHEDDVRMRQANRLGIIEPPLK